jgi:hypothetical protein
MIAAFQSNGSLHIVMSVARKGIRVQTIGYCKDDGNAADGTIQVPDWIFDGRTNAPPMFGNARVCPKCASIAKQLREPPQGA